jgi:hypothetical protein
MATSKAYDASAILFGEAKEGAIEAYNFLSSALITTIHSKNRTDKSISSAKTLAQSLFSVETATSKVTDGEDNKDTSDTDSGGDREHEGEGLVAIEGMEIVDTRGIEQKEDKAEESNCDLDSATKAVESSALSSAMRHATDNLELGLDTDEEEAVDPNTEDEEGEAYNTAEESGGEESNMIRSEDYASDATEVSSGVFEATFSKKYEDPKDFKQDLWNRAGPLPESMIVYLNLLQDELEYARTDLPFDVEPFGRLYDLLVEENGQDYHNNQKFLDSIKWEITALTGLENLDDPLLNIPGTNSADRRNICATVVCNWATEVICSRPGLAHVKCQYKSCANLVHHLCQVAWESMNNVKGDGGSTYCRHHNKFWRDKQASKSSGSLPGAQQTSHAEGAIIEPTNAAGGDKEGGQPRSMAPGVLNSCASFVVDVKDINQL